MTDPQTAADVAEPIRRLLDRVGPHADFCLSVHTAKLRAFVAEHDALLADRKRMAAELEQVRGKRAAIPENRYPGAWAELTGWVEEAVDDGGPVDAAELLAYMAELQRREREETRELMRSIFGDAAMTASAVPGATGDTQTAEQRADGLRDLTKLEGPQRGSQGDAALCLAGIPQEIADRAGLSRDALCALPAGHADPTHDDGHGLSWQGLPVPPGTSGACCSPIRRCTCCGGRR